MERAEDVSAWVVAIIAIAALVLMLTLVRGTQAHSRYEDAPVSALIEVDRLSGSSPPCDPSSHQ